MPPLALQSLDGTGLSPIMAGALPLLAGALLAIESCHASRWTTKRTVPVSDNFTT